MHRQGIIGRQAVLAACVFGSMFLLQACTSKAPAWSFPAAQPSSATTPSGDTPPAPLTVDLDTFHVAPAGAKLIALPPRLAQLDTALDAADLQATPDIFIGTVNDLGWSQRALAFEQAASDQEAFISAISLYRKAALDGYAPAQFRLGVLTAAGKGVVQDDYTAARWYLLAAEQYHRKAQVKLGLAYAQGRGVEHSSTLARLWIGRAADLSDPSGLYAQSQLYRFGIGGPIDISEADRYCRIAAHAGLDLAKTDKCGS
jgi:TPR repeat protein